MRPMIIGIKLPFEYDTDRIDFLLRHIQFCKSYLKEDGRLEPFILMIKKKYFMHMPIEVIDSNHRPSYWIWLADKIIHPDKMVFTSEVWIKKDTLESLATYKYGDLEKLKDKEEGVMVVSANFIKKTKKFYMIPVRHEGPEVNFGEPFEMSNADRADGDIGRIIEKLFTYRRLMTGEFDNKV